MFYHTTSVRNVVRIIRWFYLAFAEHRFRILNNFSKQMAFVKMYEVQIGCKFRELTMINRTFVFGWRIGTYIMGIQPAVCALFSTI